MAMKLVPLILALSSMLIPACKNSLMNNTPMHLQVDRSDDPPGLASQRKEMRDKREKSGTYTKDEQVYISNGKAMFFRHNPDYYTNPEAQMVESQTAKVIFCEGLYYFVEAATGERGYIRESDFAPKEYGLPDSSLGIMGELGVPTAPLDGVEYNPTMDNSGLFPGGGELLPGGEQPAPPKQLQERNTGRSQDFEKAKDSIKDNKPAPAITPPSRPTAPAQPAAPSLPEPSGSGAAF